jgi:hypothetical protein
VNTGAIFAPEAKTTDEAANTKNKNSLFMIQSLP